MICGDAPHGEFRGPRERPYTADEGSLSRVSSEAFLVCRIAVGSGVSVPPSVIACTLRGVLEARPNAAKGEGWRERWDIQLRDLSSIVEEDNDEDEDVDEEGVVIGEDREASTDCTELSLAYPFEDRAKTMLSTEDRLSTKSPFGIGVILALLHDNLGSSPGPGAGRAKRTRSRAPS